MRGGLASASHWRDPSLGGRVTFVVRPQNSSLQAELRINSSEAGDAGPYRCRVDFWKAATRNYKIFLALVKEPERVGLYDEAGREVTGGELVARINSSLRVECRAEGGEPPPSLRWLGREGGELAGSPSVGEGTVSSVLRLPRLSPEDAGTSLSCQAANNNLRPPLTATVRLDVLLAPVRVTIQRTVAAFEAGKRYELDCQVAGSHPPPQTSLWAAGVQLAVLTRETSRDGRLFTTVAEFLPQAHHHGAFITCRAFNLHFPGERLEDQWRVSVLWPPTARLSLQGEEGGLLAREVRQGDNLTLACSAKGNPPPYAFHWRRDGAALKTVLQEGEEGLLRLRAVGREEAGNYTCLAENSQGLGESPALALRVTFPPACVAETPLQVSAKVHQSVDLECQMVAEPRNLTFTWERGEGSERREVPSMEFTQHGSRSVLTLTPRTPADYGRVSCSSSNSLGAGNTCVFLVSRAVELPSLADCRVEAREGGVWVECREDTSPPGLRYLASLSHLESGEEVELTADSPSFHFPRPPPGALLSLTIVGLAREGDSHTLLTLPVTIQVTSGPCIFF